MLDTEALVLQCNKLESLESLKNLREGEKEVNITRKRGWGEITADILEATLKPEKKMRIMYKSNLNFERFDKYFQELLGKGLIEALNDSDGKTAYVISARGKTLLSALKKARDIFDS